MKKLYCAVFHCLCGLSAISQPVFTEVALSVGINHHASFSNIDMPAEGGAAWFDYDNDGWYDLYLTGGTSADVFYRNNGDGTFEDVTVAAGFMVLAERTTTGVTTGDVNRDGWNDVLITTVKSLKNFLFLNNGDGSFSMQPDWSEPSDSANSFSATFGDLNLDGWLDLYVCNWSRNFEVSVNGPLVTVDSESNYCYINDGDGTFSSRAQQLGIDDSLGCALGVMFTDFDNDHDPDIFIANDFGYFTGNSPNRMYRNNHPALGFTEVSTGLGLNTEMNGMGVAKADLNGDLKLDYLITNIRTDKLMISSVFNYTDEAIQRGLQNDSVWLLDLSQRVGSVSWGCAFLDLDNDADEDLVVANGSLYYDYPNPALDSNKMYLNNGGGSFTDISMAIGMADTYVSRALAYCDYDRDGDLDIFIGITDTLTGISTSKLYRNDSNSQQWLQVKATGVQNNTNGIGAKVYTYTQGLVQMREIGGESSFNSQHWQVAHFGIAGAHTIDSIDVVWPGGHLDRFTDVQTNQFVEVIEGQGMLTDIKVNPSKLCRVYPNPASNHLVIEGQDLRFIELIDTKGGLVRSVILNRSDLASIQISELAKGNYLTRIGLGSGEIVIRKIVVQ